MNAGLLPWHSGQWRVVTEAVTRDRLPQALLLHGPRGLGKRQFMQALSRFLVCASPQSGQACGQCQPCRQFSEMGAHADIFALTPEEAGKQIRIDAAREAIAFSALGAHYGGRKLLLIEPAEALNINAANALLKTLEEPAGETVLILLSHQPSRLLPTIRSRCLQLRFTRPDTTTACEWLREQGVETAETLLREAQGYPMRALAMFENGTVEWRRQRDKELAAFLRDKRSASGLARLWMGYEPADIHAWLHDRLRRINWTVQGQAAADEGNAALQTLTGMPRLQAPEPLANQLNLFHLSDLNNINKQLCLESILISISDDDSAERSP